MDAQDKIDDIAALVAGARSMPMSGSCILPRDELLAMLEELSALLPAQLRQAHYVLRDRDQVVAEGEREAERIVAAARAEQNHLLSESEVLAEAAREADALLDAAREEAATLREETDDYVDGKLAGFETLLAKTLSTVRRGRERLAAADATGNGESLAEPAPGPLTRQQTAGR